MTVADLINKLQIADQYATVMMEHDGILRPAMEVKISINSATLVADNTRQFFSEHDFNSYEG